MWISSESTHHIGVWCVSKEALLELLHFQMRHNHDWRHGEGSTT